MNLSFFGNLIAADGNGSFPLVLVGGVLEANRKWDIGKEVLKQVFKDFPQVRPIRPKVFNYFTENFLFNKFNALIK